MIKLSKYSQLLNCRSFHSGIVFRVKQKTISSYSFSESVAVLTLQLQRKCTNRSNKCFIKRQTKWLIFYLCLRSQKSPNSRQIKTSAFYLINAKATQLPLRWWQVHWILGWEQGAQKKKFTTYYLLLRVWGRNGDHFSLEALSISIWVLFHSLAWSESFLSYLI